MGGREGEGGRERRHILSDRFELVSIEQANDE